MLPVPPPLSHPAARAAVLLLALAGADLDAQVPIPQGGDFLVNSTTAGDQSSPVVATDLDGDFVAVWQSQGQDGGGFGIYAQRFSDDGSDVGVEFRVNQTAAQDQVDPAVAINDDGEFVVAWVGFQGNGARIYAQLFDDGGMAVGGELAVSPLTPPGAAEAPSVAINEDGVSLVVWQGPATGDGAAIVGRYISAAGQLLGNAFRINVATAGDQIRPSVASVDESGDFVVVWEGEDSSGRGIRFRLLDEFGGFVTTELPVNSAMAGDQTRPAVAVRGDDNASVDNGFVVVWQGPDGSMGNSQGIFGRRFAESGLPDGMDFAVNPVAAGLQAEPSVTVDDDGAFVVTWSLQAAIAAAGPRGNPIVIRGRRFGGGGTRGGPGPEFPINVGGLDNRRPTVAAAGDGDFVAVWQSAGTDGGGDGVFGRRFALGLFADGFETGNLGAWSQVFP